MLLSNQADIADILAVAYVNAQRDVVTGSELIHKPPQAMGLVVLVTGHDVDMILADGRQIAWSSNSVFKFGVLGRAVVVGNIVRVSRDLPRALGALNCSFESPAHPGFNVRSRNHFIPGLP